MRRLNRPLVFGVLILGGSAQAAIIESFETGTNGFEPLATLGISTTTGVTEGLQALAIPGSGFQWLQSHGTSNAVMLANATALTGVQKVWADFTIPALPTGGSGIGPWAKVQFMMNDGPGGWRTTPEYLFPQLVGGATGPGLYTVAFDISGLAAPNYAAGNWFRYGFSVNWDAATHGTLYLDAIRTTQAVPEPTSFAVLGIGAIALLRRKLNRA